MFVELKASYLLLVQCCKYCLVAVPDHEWEVTKPVNIILTCDTIKAIDI